jgi:predicted helicase
MCARHPRPAASSQLRRVEVEPDSIMEVAYRPFDRQAVYFNADLNHRTGRLQSLFPTPLHVNLGFYVTGVGSDKPFSAHITDRMPDLAYWGSSNGRYLSRYWYRKITPGEMLTGPTEQGFERVDNITDAAQMDYRRTYSDPSITKEDVFYYVYGLLHSPAYLERFESDLRKSLPHIPKVEDFTGFSVAGRRLAQLHLDYEQVEPFAGIEEEVVGSADSKDLYRVFKKMKFALRGDRTRIVYNSRVTLTGIPEAAFRYRLGSRSAIEWIMDRYWVRTDKASGIVNDPNDWSDDPRYIIDLLKRIVTVSLETMKTVDSLPPLDMLPDQ